MPELPEVETIKSGLKKNIIGREIIDFKCDSPKMINYPLKQYQGKIIGNKIIDVARKAKMLQIKLTNDLNVLIHLKMTGQLVFKKQSKILIGGHQIEKSFEDLPNKFTHAQFQFDDKSFLYFNDIRKFGWLRLYTDDELKEHIENLELGPEPLEKEFSFDYFKKQIKQKPNSKIKQFLLNQQNLVGVGNIYADETCFFAKVKPRRLNKTLKNNEIELLYKGIKQILKKAIKAQGTTFSNYVNADGNKGTFVEKLKVYGRVNQNCYECDSKIKKIKIGGRSSSYCPQCQK